MKLIPSRTINVAVKAILSLSLLCGGESFVVNAAPQTTANKTSNKKTGTSGNGQKKTTSGTSKTGTSKTGAGGGTKTGSKSGTAAGSKTSAKGVASKTAPKTTTTKTNARRAGGKSAAVETSADVKKQQEATRREIKRTEAQIRENEQKVKSGLNALGKLQDEIGASKSKIAATSTQITQLNGRISGLESGIATNEKELQRLREEYLKAVKKMRLARGGNSALSFIFSSDNFSQALRRMRYLRQFSEWKEQQSNVIDSTTRKLKSQREDLAKMKIQQDDVLKLQKKDQAVLQEQYAKQDALVADLRQNGTALKNHLSKKQAEANQLNSRIAALIAEEQRKAEEARRAEEARKAEAARKAAEEKARREAEERRIAEAKAAADKAAEEKRLAEKATQEKLLADNATKEKGAPDKDANDKKAQDKAAKEAAARDKAAKDKAAKEAAAKEKAAKDKASKERALADNSTKSKEKESNQSFASARKRAPRNTGKTVAAVSKVESSGSTASSSVSKPTGKSGGDFLAMKGSLPRPVSGSFRVTSRFGRQSLPDLPDVVYDNPGIDAEVASGASAAAVFGGKVSGVYMIPGYNTVVIVNHGSYYTVYGNISSPSVKVGDAVSTGQKLGSLAPDEDNKGHSSIHFEVWRNREKLNPLDWIR